MKFYHAYALCIHDKEYFDKSRISSSSSLETVLHDVISYLIHNYWGLISDTIKDSDDECIINRIINENEDADPSKTKNMVVTELFDEIDITSLEAADDFIRREILKWIHFAEETVYTHERLYLEIEEINIR